MFLGAGYPIATPLSSDNGTFITISWK